MHLWIIQYFPYVQNAYLCGKKGKDIVHIFTTFPKGSNKISVKIYVPVYLKFSWMKPNLWMEDIFFKYAIKARIYSIKKVIQVIKNCQTNSIFFLLISTL